MKECSELLNWTKEIKLRDLGHVMRRGYKCENLFHYRRKAFAKKLKDCPHKIRGRIQMVQSSAY